MNKTYNITIDLVKKNVIVNNLIFKKSETGAQIVATILNNGVAVDVTGATVTLEIEKSDASTTSNTGALTTPVSGIVTFDLVAGDLDTVGLGRMELKADDASDIVISKVFGFEVKDIIA